MVTVPLSYTTELFYYQFLCEGRFCSSDLREEGQAGVCGTYNWLHAVINSIHFNLQLHSVSYLSL